MADTFSSEHFAIKKLHETLNYFVTNGTHKGIGQSKKFIDIWLQVSETKIKKVAAILQVLKQMVLIADDIMDESTKRQGIPTAHLIFGLPHTVATITYSLSYAAKKMIDLQEPELVYIFIKRMLQAFRGQGFEIYFRNNFQCPTEEEYINYVLLKTNSLYLLNFELLQTFSENKQDFTKLMTLLGNAIQITNDYINLQSPAYSRANGYCEDISSGTFTFPIIHAIQCQSNEHQIINILKERTKQKKTILYCLSLLEKYRSFDYTKVKVLEMKEAIIEESKKFPKNLIFNEYLDQSSEQLNPEAPLSPTFAV